MSYIHWITLAHRYAHVNAHALTHLLCVGHVTCLGGCWHNSFLTHPQFYIISLVEYRERQLARKEPFLGIGLSSRKNLCVHPEVSKERHGALVDAKCMNLTASWLREGANTGDGCDFFEVSVLA